MNLRQIEAFKAVVEAGTVSQAAELMRISQPAVSKLVQGFERATGFPLFDRVRGRLSLTAEGRLLYQEVEQVFAGASRIRRVAEEIRTLKHGSLAIGAMPALSVGFIQQVVARFTRERPAIHVSVHARSSQKLAEWLLSRQLDIGFSAYPLEYHGIESEPLERSAAVCILPPGHRLAERAVIEVGDLEGEPFISFGEGAVTRRHIDAVFEAARVRRVMAFEAPMAPTVCAFVAQGLGVAILHPLFIGGFARTVEIRPFRPDIEIQLGISYPRQPRQPALVQAFAAEAKATVLSR